MPLAVRQVQDRGLRQEGRGGRDVLVRRLRRVPAVWKSKIRGRFDSRQIGPLSTAFPRRASRGDCEHASRPRTLRDVRAQWLISTQVPGRRRVQKLRRLPEEGPLRPVVLRLPRQRRLNPPPRLRVPRGHEQLLRPVQQLARPPRGTPLKMGSVSPFHFVVSFSTRAEEIASAPDARRGRNRSRRAGASGERRASTRSKTATKTARASTTSAPRPTATRPARTTTTSARPPAR